MMNPTWAPGPNWFLITWKQFGNCLEVDGSPLEMVQVRFWKQVVPGGTRRYRVVPGGTGWYRAPAGSGALCLCGSHAACFALQRPVNEDKSPVGPWLLALFVFVVCGSGEFPLQNRDLW